MAPTVTGVRQERNVPEAIRSLSTLARADYVDVFTVTTRAAPTHRPEDWARTVVETAGARGQFVWRRVLGLRLEQGRSDGHIGGWKVTGRGDCWIRVEAASWFLTGQIVVHVGQGSVSVATFGSYDHPVARVIWPPISVLHRRAVPMLLGAAARAPLETGSGAMTYIIDRIAADFRVLDVWPLPIEGRRDEFDRLVDRLASFDPANTESRVVRTLFWVRFRIGGWLGWDDPDKRRTIPGSAESTLSDRLPDDLRLETTAAAGTFKPLYRTDDEWAGEISNDTVHGVLHLAWVRQTEGRYRGQVTVYVKPRGRLGEMYLRLIKPFRHLVVYPALIRQLGRGWERETTPGR